jgi:glycosyl transferase family 2
MDVSVVLPTYNRARVLTDAIESARCQTHDRFELIVVDDGSTDETEIAVRAIPDARVQYVRQRHAGAAAARNIGVRLSQAPIIAFLDSDDFWTPGKLAADVRFLAEYPQVDAVFSDAARHDDGVFIPSFTRATSVFAKRLTSERQPRMILTARGMFLELLEEDPIVTPTLAVRREAFLRAGGFDERTEAFEDWEFLLRLARTSQFGYIDEAFATLRTSADSLHVVRGVPAKLAMIRCLLIEARRSRDPEVRAAARRGAARLRVRLGWEYERLGHRLPALRNFVTAFVETGDVMFLGRTVWGLVPPPIAHRLGARRQRRRLIERPSIADAEKAGVGAKSA